MPNTANERQKIKLALNLISVKYSSWIAGNPNLFILLGSDTAKFDKVVRFLDTQEYKRQYAMNNISTKIGGHVIAFTSRISYSATSVDTIICIDRSFVDSEVLVHELLHYLTHPVFTQNVSTDFNEGITQYFTKKTLGRMDMISPDDELMLASYTGADRPPMGAAYPDQISSVNNTRNTIKNAANLPTVRRRRNPVPPPPPIVTKDMFKRAYFKGDLEMIGLIKSTSSLS